MQTFYKICLILMIVGGINWGLVGLFQFDFVGWLLGGSASIWSRIVFTLVGVAAVCGIPGLFTDETGGIETKKKGSHAGRKYGTRAFLNTYKESRPVVCGNQTYPCGQVGALSPVSRFLIEPSWSTHDGEVCNPPMNSKLPLND